MGQPDDAYPKNIFQESGYHLSHSFGFPLHPASRHPATENWPKKTKRSSIRCPWMPLSWLANLHQFAWLAAHRRASRLTWKSGGQMLVLNCWWALTPGKMKMRLPKYPQVSKYSDGGKLVRYPWNIFDHDHKEAGCWFMKFLHSVDLWSWTAGGRSYSRSFGRRHWPTGPSLEIHGDGRNRCCNQQGIARRTSQTGRA